ncbi:Zinc finger FYVE domain-containing protein 1 [Frankliniella fusca]|uniref:Zinc finger FYVE domain-containing protein 1 n=1 Tax=Frankliniella fusca TaxID=407009 RepID=A0AAE1LGJ8_9NEOP|nr:Zinc finger FYVE domain-containing protein 1 [Frankliniella fusca]
MQQPCVQVSPALMQSLDSFSASDINSEPRSMASLQDITVTSEKFTSLRLHSVSESKSFLLLDGNEYLQVASAEKFASCLGCPNSSSKVKVVSIVGNSGDGKSYTMNKVFFQGEEVFQTSSEQTSCTMGVWAAFDPCLNVITLDTEGLLGTTKREGKRTRLLLKILAVSDIVIYRTRAERLHADMFKFLGSASQAFTNHFRAALGNVNFGPAVIIFHETCDTKPLKGSSNESVEDILRSFYFNQLKTDAFSSLRYIGVQTKGKTTDFSDLRRLLQDELSNTSVRSARQTDIVFNALKVLNDKFNGEVTDPQPMYLSEEYFTCSSKCLSCGRRCEASMGHQKDDQPHIFQAQYNNILYTCKACHIKGHQVVVTPSEPSWLDIAKHAWSGYTINCPFCGEIYRSRQYWYGNKSPEDTVVRTEITHVWPGSNSQNVNSQNTAQKVLDGITFLSEAVASVGSQPSRYLSSQMADLIAPKYWRPNNEIHSCFLCKKAFSPAETKHHCRSCGEGFCDECSSFSRPVPERGWTDKVRVCKSCNEIKKETRVPYNPNDNVEVRARKYGEVVVNTFSSVASVLQYPKELIKDSARPTYWVPDHEAKTCAVCKEQFGPLLSLHHCRDCGQAVCHPCSLRQRKVPKRGWDTPVRVCNNCMKED